MSHLTDFYRDIGTLYYIKDYLKDIKEPSILVGACSTGEEALALKLLLNRPDVKITGFDISPIVIALAKLGIIYNDTHSVKDSSLSKTDIENFSTKRNEMYKIFNENFIQFWPKVANNKPGTYYKYKFPIGIDYRIGDAMDLENIAGGKKYDVFSFKNAIYMLIGNLTDDDEYLPFDLQQQACILQKFVKSINKILSLNGLFAFSEFDIKRETDPNFFQYILYINGFSKTDYPHGNIWRKTRDI